MPFWVKDKLSALLAKAFKIDPCCWIDMWDFKDFVNGVRVNVKLSVQTEPGFFVRPRI